MGQGIAWNTMIDPSYVSQYVDYARGCSVIDGPARANRRIVSIGSGSGIHERKIEDDLKCQIICVDPSPHSFAPAVNAAAGEKGHAPDYMTAQDLIKADKTIIGDCDMIIIWSTPNDSKYDMEAITLLQPVTVTIIFEVTGSAGSLHLHRWIDASGGPQQSEFERSIDTPRMPNPIHKYTAPACYTKKHYTEMDSFEYALLLMTRNDVVPRNITIPVGVIDDAKPGAHHGSVADQLYKITSRGAPQKTDSVDNDSDESMALLLMQMLKMANKRGDQ